MGYIRAMARAKIIIVNGEGIMSRFVPKKKGQVYINTWHGSLGIKRINPEDIKTNAVNRLCCKSADFFDINVSNSDFEDRIYRDTFWPNVEIFRAGHPRNDVLAVCDEGKRQSLKRRIFGGYLPGEYRASEPDLSDARVCLYAPTFRDDNSTDVYSLDCDALRRSLRSRFGGEWVIFVRFHPRLLKMKIALGDSFSVGGVFDLTGYPDIQDLLFVADAAITDYSSCICDFVLTKRPAFIFATDIDDYNDERGFYYSLYDSPWPVAKNNTELADNIANYDDAKYKLRCEEFLEEMGCIEDGHASERVSDKIVEIIERG
jgi:CDP-glycerol glycerophosphotransferase